MTTAVADTEVAERDEVDSSLPEVNAGTDAPVNAGDTDVATSDDAPADWFDDDAKEFGESYGLSEKDARSLGSVDAIRRYGALFDRGLTRTRRQPPADVATPAPAKPKAKASEEPEFDLDAIALDGYDDDTKKLVGPLLAFSRAAKKQLEESAALLNSLAAQRDEETQFAMINGFHDVVDGMDEQRYGRSVGDQGLSLEQDEARRQLWDAYHLLKGALEDSGRPVPSDRVLMKRAEMQIFGDDVIDQARQEVRSQAKRQAGRRRPVGHARSTTAPRPADDGSPAAIMRDPEVVNFLAALEGK